MTLEGLLAEADRIRRVQEGSAYELWKLADQLAPRDEKLRRDLYVHAGLHAGYFVDKETGKPFPVCPTCEAVLG